MSYRIIVTLTRLVVKVFNSQNKFDYIIIRLLRLLYKKLRERDFLKGKRSITATTSDTFPTRGPVEPLKLDTSVSTNPTNRENKIEKFLYVGTKCEFSV